MAELIAVDGATLFQDDPLVVCTITPVGVPSVIDKAEGNGFLLDGYQVSVSAITYPSAGATIRDSGPYVVAFASGATKVKDSGTLVLLEGDLTAIINAAPQIPASPSPTPYPISFKIEITVAGQTTVKAN
jgi:hypothetical protein